ncbi:MAG: heparan-alpha-glucosaminide N-acetyltransferase domain-containing protein [Gemmatimonadota bacterium]|nr:heparan-alpha-glucosaminide N-acetyltransferase domain-containing protein [Gemmatimonadota bacterium]
MIRVASVDLLRGAVMILMALDHTRDFFSRLRFAPEDLARSYPALFMTRWVTHFCAPIFFLLAGVGASLSLSAGRSRKQLSFFLLTRGLWLVFLELTLIHFGWWFAYQPPFILVVIWALGWSMVILSALVFLPHRAIAAIALVAIFGHNLLDGIRPESFGAVAPVWNVLHAPGMAVPGKIIVGYPLIPWSAVMALGFTLGDVFRWEASRRKRFLIQMGGAGVVLFVLLRSVNGYGDPVPWAPQRSAAMTAVSFLNTLKYPPSLLFLLMTLGPALIALALFERARGRVVDAISIIGRVPLFYYVTHLYVIHALASGLALWQGGQAAFLGLDTGSFPAWYGTGLPGVYLAWAIVVTILYFPCRWFARVKSTRRNSWLGYM